MPTKHTIPKVVKLDKKICDRLEKLGKDKDRSVHWLMRQAIEQYLDEEEYYERINRETLASWEEVKQGKVVSHEAMVKWLDSWGTDEELDPPCVK